MHSRLRRTCRFRLLGSIEVVGEQPIVHSGTRRFALLAFLIRAGQRVLTDELGDVVWGGGAADGARKRTRVALNRLRRVLVLVQAGTSARVATVGPAIASSGHGTGSMWTSSGTVSG